MVEGCCKPGESQTKGMSMGFTKAGKTIAMSHTAGDGDGERIRCFEKIDV
jgi:hypothetical protein